jgi:hypothetical protein
MAESSNMWWYHRLSHAINRSDAGERALPRHRFLYGQEPENAVVPSTFARFQRSDAGERARMSIAKTRL